RVTGNRGRIARRRGRIEPGARLHERAHEKANDEREAGDDLEVEERLATYTADLLDTIHAGNARRDGAEDHERDHHRDQADEPVAKRTHRHGGIWRDIPQNNRDGDAQEHLSPQASVKRLRGGGSNGCGMCGDSGHGGRYYTHPRRIFSRWQNLDTSVWAPWAAGWQTACSRRVTASPASIAPVRKHSG